MQNEISYFNKNGISCCMRKIDNKFYIDLFNLNVLILKSLEPSNIFFKRRPNKEIWDIHYKGKVKRLRKFHYVIEFINHIKAVSNPN